MKKCTKKSILQKTIIAIIITLSLSNFIVPTYSQADIGGVLMDPITDLFCSIGDVVINLLQKCMTGDWASFSLFNGGFLVDSETFFDSPDYANRRTSETGEEINPNDPDNGFNKVLLTGKTQDYYIPIATYSPEQIFAGNVQGLDINFINPNFDGEYVKDIWGKVKKDSDGNPIPLSSAAQLQPTIATWYVALRNLTIVGLLSVLVYVAIRIIISSTAADKAKYKQMLMDWLIALCLVFFLHYIMSFTLTLTQSICEAIAGAGNETVVITVEGKGSFKTNLLGAARFKTQYNDLGQKVAYLIMYLALVIYTVLFTWFYLKRLLMMAFLTLIAPVVALTYPIDKMNDGKAQAFDSWLKEYVFNALIQPFHLIIYTVFVGSAMDLASTNIIYMIAALAFIMPAEKILRKFFGFEKAGAGTLGSLAGAAAIGSIANKAVKAISGGGSKGETKKDSSGDNESGENKPPRYEDKHDINQIGDGGASGGEDTNPQNDSETTETDIHQRANEELAEEQQNAQAQARAQQQGEANPTPTENPEQAGGKNKFSFENWRNAHNINKRSAKKAVYKGIKGVAKFGTKTAFKAGAGSLAAAVTLASGGGFAAAGAAFMAGSALGGKAADGAIKLAGKAESGAFRAGRVAKATKDYLTRPNKFDPNMQEEKFNAIKDAALGGTRLGRELDLGHGNKRYQTAGAAQAWKKDENNEQYVREYLAAKNGGVAPSAEKVKAQMDSFDPYLAEGMTDIKDMLNAQKAEQYGISGKQAAIIAAIGKERGITADVLNDDKKFNAQRNNMIHEHMSKGKNETEATKLTDHTMNVLKAQNGVANNLQKPKTKK